MEAKRLSIGASRRAVVRHGSSAEPHEAIVPTKWEKLIANRPCFVVVGTLFVSFALIGILVAVGFPKFSNGGFSALNSKTQLGIDALEEMLAMGRTAQDTARENSDTVCRPIADRSRSECDLLWQQGPDNGDEFNACFDKYVGECDSNSKCRAGDLRYTGPSVGPGGPKSLSGFECFGELPYRRRLSNDGTNRFAARFKTVALPTLAQPTNTRALLTAGPELDTCRQNKVDGHGQRSFTMYADDAAARGAAACGGCRSPSFQGVSCAPISLHASLHTAHPSPPRFSSGTTKPRTAVTC